MPTPRNPTSSSPEGECIPLPVNFKLYYYAFEVLMETAEVNRVSPFKFITYSKVRNIVPSAMQQLVSIFSQPNSPSISIRGFSSSEGLATVVLLGKLVVCKYLVEEKQMSTEDAEVKIRGKGKLYASADSISQSMLPKSGSVLIGTSKGFYVMKSNG